MLNTSERDLMTLRKRLLAFAELRDALFFVASALYACGYLTWAAYSADRGLGVLPPLEGQYFLAGAIPFLVIVGAYAALRSIEPVPEEKRPHAERIGRRFVFGGCILLGLSFLIERVAPAREGTQNILLMLGMALVYAAGGYETRAAGFGAKWMRWAFRALILVLALAGGLVYATRGFPLLPPELGGPSRICVTLDLTRSALSPTTLELLVNQPIGDVPAVRTRPLWLHFVGGGVLIISPDAGRPARVVVRIREGVVSALTRATGCS